MNRALTGSVFLLTCLAPVGCDSVDVGRPDDPEGGPQIHSIIVQDGNRRGGRFISTRVWADGKATADTPLLECSYTNPCPAEFGAADLETGAPITCSYTAEELAKPLAEQKGTCPDPMHPKVHPPIVGVPGRGTQIRAVFNKQLDNKIDALLQADGQAIAVLRDSAGMAVAGHAFYDNTGVDLRVAFPFAEPAGPAIVFIPDQDAFFAGEKYTLSLDAAQIKDKSGAAATIAASYEFTTEALHPYNGIDPNSLGDPLDSEDVISLYLNSGATVPAATQTTDMAVQKDGQGVFVTLFIDGNCDGDGDNTQVNIARTSSTGEPLEWEDGNYTFDLTNYVTSAGASHGKLSGDALGSAFAGEFTVTATSAESDYGFGNFTLPSQCP